MKIHIYAAPKTLLLTMLLVVALVGTAAAQLFPAGPPLLPTGRPGIHPLHYFGAGVKWRNLQRVRFEYKAHWVGNAGGATGWVQDPNETEFDESVWAPYVEFGLLRTPFFGLILSATGFSFRSADSIVNAAVLTNPAGTPVQETLTNELDVTVLEFLLGGRSRFPMYGLGSVGVSFGGIFAPTPYKLVTTSQVIAAGGGLAPGTVVQSVRAKTEDTWFNFGVEGAVDIEIGVERFFLKAGVQWDWYFLNAAHKGTMIDTSFNPSGLGLSLMGGIRF